MVDAALIAEFDQEMFRIYQRALLEANYKATRFLHMLHEHGGVQTALILIRSPKVSEGYTAIWERRRLDLTVEAVIHDNPKWHQLFDQNDLATCANRLKKYEYPSAR